MSDFSIAGDTPAHRCKAEVSDETLSASALPRISVKSWQIDILLVILGLPALVFFVALGGAFGLLGPWVIYMGVLSIRKRKGSGGHLLRILTGASLFCLSAAALLASIHLRSWRVAGGLLGLLAGASYLATTLVTMRKISHLNNLT